jgi:hypothetical protein
MRVEIKLRGLFNPSERRAWERQLFEAQRKAVHDGMRDWARTAGLPAVRDAAASGLKLRGSKVTRTFVSKLWNARRMAMPALQIYSKIWWMGAHVEGATIRPRSGKLMIIPVGSAARLGARKFAKIMRDLHSTGNLHFVKKGGRVLVFAEQLKENSRSLMHFRKGHRTREGMGKKQRLNRATELLIGVGVPQVRLQRKFSLVNAVERVLPRLAADIEQRLAFGMR